MQNIFKMSGQIAGMNSLHQKEENNSYRRYVRKHLNLKAQPKKFWFVSFVCEKT